MDFSSPRVTTLWLLAALASGTGLALTQPSHAQPSPAAKPEKVDPLTTTTVVTPKSDPSPLVQTLVGPSATSMEVQKRPAATPDRPRHRRVASRHRRAFPSDPDRPPLVGIVLAAPILPPPAVPRPIVPAPAYFIDGIASLLTTPPPPIVCERRPADRSLPAPHLYREVPVACTYDVN